MTTSAATEPQGTKSGPYKRSVRNYLIDSRFQLKYTGILVLVAVVIAGILGTFLWRTSRDVVAASTQLSVESKKVSQLSKEQVVKLGYGDEGDFMKDFSKESDAYDKRVDEQQAALVRQQSTMLYTLVGTLGLLVILIGLYGIYFTHKVAGPIYKMKRLLRQVGEGRLTIDGRLRKGDELHHFFEEFQTMVERLRERQSAEIAELDRAIEIAERSGASSESIAKVSVVRDQMKRALEH